MNTRNTNGNKENRRIKNLLLSIPKPLLYILATVSTVYLIFYFFMFLFYDDWSKSGTLGDTFGIINALFSAIGTAGIIYTLYLQNDTLKLQITTLEVQNKTFKTSIRPLLEIVSEGVQERNGYLKLKVRNIGNGTAINIEILPFTFTIDDPENTPYRFKVIHYKNVSNKKFNLQSNITNYLYINAFDEHNNPIPSLFLDILDERYSDFQIPFEVKYMDVSSEEHTQSFHLGATDGSINMI